MKLGQSNMIFVQIMRMKREENYSVYRAILMAQGMEENQKNEIEVEY
jgi:hypothetical protein